MYAAIDVKLLLFQVMEPDKYAPVELSVRCNLQLIPHSYNTYINRLDTTQVGTLNMLLLSMTS